MVTAKVVMNVIKWSISFASGDSETWLCSMITSNLQCNAQLLTFSQSHARHPGNATHLCTVSSPYNHSPAVSYTNAKV